MLRSLGFASSASILLAFSAESPASPNGLWHNREEGIVIRMEPCGAAFCGYAAGLLPGNRNAKRDKARCGSMIFRDFNWNPTKARWEGSMQPPDLNKQLKASATLTEPSQLTIRASLGILSKTLVLHPFSGSASASCVVEEAQQEPSRRKP